MEHPTALVIDDATTHKCSCAKLVAAGWRVNCSACGRSQFTLADLEADEEGLATTDGWDGSIEPYDVDRDDRLTDDEAA